MAGRVRTVAVAGSGIVAWSAALALRRRMPGIEVVLVAYPASPGALADRIGSTLPSITDFHADLGLDETELAARTGAGFRLGTCFEDWAEGCPAYVHAYGEYGRPLLASAFHQLWLKRERERGGKAAPFDAYSPGASLAATGKFVHPSPDPSHPLSAFAYGLQLDPLRYRDYLRHHALRSGVVERQGSIRSVRLCEDGSVDALVLEDGSEAKADLFVDCTGPEAVLRSALDPSFEDWSHWLLCDRVLFAAASAAEHASSLDRVTALAGGWCWKAAAGEGMSRGLVYASASLSESKAERVLRTATAAVADGPSIPIRQGRRLQPWLRNCVAIGDAAVALEPLEWANLHLAQSAIDRMVTMMPDRDFAPVELAEYNRQCGAEAERVRDFLLLHYVTGRRPRHEFWRAAASVPLPLTLAHTLELFSERGTLPFHEEETFARDSWLAVLIGQGTRPRRTDPLAEAVSPEQADRAMASLRDALSALASSLPSHAAYVRNMSRRAAQ